MKMKRETVIAATVVTTGALTPLLASDNEPAKRLDAAAAVVSEIMARQIRARIARL